MNWSRLHRWCTALVVGGVALSVATPAHAQQQYTITGRVVEATSRRPVPSATVRIGGTPLGTATGDSGQFTLLARVQPGTYELEVMRIGFGRQATTLRLGDQLAVDVGTIELKPAAIQLSEVVVTGTGAPTERRELGNTVASVSGAEVNQAPAAQSVDKALQGKVLGAVISQNNGQPGGGVSIRLRGTGSILGGAEPLIVIDGVIVENNSEALVSLGANASRGGAALSNSLADIAPGDIERVEVVKGAAAAALYGSRANNGVIQIFTKRGQQGKPSLSIRTELGTGEAPKRYALNDSPLSGRGDQLFVPGAPAMGQPIQRYLYQDQLFQRSAQVTNQLSVTGGNAGTSYYASALWQNETGIMRSTDLSNVNVHASLTQSLSDKLSFTLGGNYIQRKTDFVPEGEQTQGVITTLIFTPTSWNPAYDPNLGRFPYSPILGTNPLDVIAHWTARDNTDRVVASFNSKWTPMANLTVNYLFGFDRISELFDYYQPAQSTSAAFTGSVQTPTRNVQRFNNDITVTHTATPASFLSTTTTIGARQTNDHTNEVRAAALGLSPGQTTVGGGGATPAASQGITDLRTLGGFVQERVGIRGSLFVTGGLNYEASSAFGRDQRWQAFPRLGASWNVNDEPYWSSLPLAGALSTLRLRAAYGETGGQPPSAYSIFNNYVVASRAGKPALIPGSQQGNPDLKPERQHEIEAGFDLGLLQDRASLEFTWYRKRSTDLVLGVPQPLSSGYSTQLQNVGALTNRGIEMALEGRILDLPGLRWSSRLNYAANRNRVDRLVTANDTLPSGYLNYVMVGQPVGVFYGAYYPRDANGNIVVTGRLDASCNPIGGTAGIIVSRARGANCTVLKKILGNPEPRFTLSWNNDVNVGQNLQLSVLFDGRFGNKVANFSRRISEYFGAGASNANEQCVVAVNGATYCQETLNSERHLLYEEFIEDGSFVKLRELSLRYTLAPSLVQRFGAHSAVVSLSGRNLYTWTKYTGIDPEVNLFSANTVARGVEFGTSPIPRMVVFGLNLGF